MKREVKYDYDLLIIGSGPAGTHAAVQAAKCKAKVAIIEKTPTNVGGAWIHTGTLPSKTLRESMAAIQAVGHHVGQKWVDRIVNEFSAKQLLSRAHVVSNNEDSIVKTYLENNEIEVIRGYGLIEGEHEVRVNTPNNPSQVFTAKNILIATGSRPRRPAEIPFDGWRVVCSDQILKIDAKPKSMVIYGAGVIGCEYACIFSTMGIDCTVVDGRSTLLRYVDQEIAEELKSHMEEHGVTFKLGYELGEIVPNHSNVTVNYGDEQKEVDLFFFAGGRTSNTDKIGLENVGIEVNNRSAIVVNDFFQTNIPSIYAAGDAIGSPALAATSAEQGRHACLHALDKLTYNFPKVFPIGIYTIPEVSAVGKTEEELKEAGVDYEVGHAELEEVARGQIRGDSHGLLKILVCKKTHLMLGIHIVGADAANLVHIGQAFMVGEKPIQHIVNNMIFNYPTLAEAYRVAAFNCLNKLFPSGDIGEPPSNKETKSAA